MRVTIRDAFDASSWADTPILASTCRTSWLAVVAERTSLLSRGGGEFDCRARATGLYLG